MKLKKGSSYPEFKFWGWNYIIGNNLQGKENCFEVLKQEVQVMEGSSYQGLTV